MKISQVFMASPLHLTVTWRPATYADFVHQDQEKFDTMKMNSRDESAIDQFLLQSHGADYAVLGSGADCGRKGCVESTGLHVPRGIAWCTGATDIISAYRFHIADAIYGRIGMSGAVLDTAPVVADTVDLPRTPIQQEHCEDPWSAWVRPPLPDSGIRAGNTRESTA